LLLLSSYQQEFTNSRYCGAGISPAGLVVCRLTQERRQDAGATDHFGGSLGALAATAMERAPFFPTARTAKK
jgi:hypothetical protein